MQLRSPQPSVPLYQQYPPTEAPPAPQEAPVVVMTVEPVIELSVALIVLVPAATPVASPPLLVIVAFDVSLDAQATVPVMTLVVASV